VLVNRVATVVVAGCGLALTGGSFAAGSRQLLVAYAVVACSNWTTTVCQYEVLKYLSFAASTLTKCAKILPVMAWGRVVLRKRYGSADVAVAVAVTFGCFLFAMDRGVLRTSPTVGGATKKHDDAFAAFDDGNGGKGIRRGGGAREDVVVKAADAHESAKAIAKARRAKTRAAAAASAAAIAASGAASAKDDEMIVTGAVIMLVYLACDGFTSTTQQWLFRRHATPVLSQIFFTTCFACVFSFAWLSSTSQLGEAIGFVTRHPRALQDVFVLAVSACAAQFAINYTIYCFGAVTLASVMTFRQFLAVVLSCFAFGTPLTGAQWFALVLILAPVMKRIDSGAVGRYFAPESDGGGTKREKDVEGGRGRGVLERSQGFL
jgi:adenosine 3'-phospho 5'-phosphosulfate transporter B2